MQIIDLENTKMSGTIKQIKYKSQLTINKDLHFSFYKNQPNIWFRFWTKLLLGWEWKSLENKEN